MLNSRISWPVCIHLFFTFEFDFYLICWTECVGLVGKETKKERRKNDERNRIIGIKYEKKTICPLTWMYKHDEWSFNILLLSLLFDLEIIHVFLLASLFYFKRHWFDVLWLIMFGSSSPRLLLCLPDGIYTYTCICSESRRKREGRVMSVYSITVL